MFGHGRSLGVPRGPGKGRCVLAVAATVLLASVLALDGCGGSDSISHPTGPNEVVIQVTTGGGLVPLFDPSYDYGVPGVADGPTTTVEIYADEATYRSEIYALTIAGAGGLTLEQQQARAAVNDLIGRLALVSPLVPGDITWGPYQYSALAVYRQPVGDDPVDGGVPPNRLEWPLGDLSALGAEVPQGGFRRAVIAGDDLESLRPLVEQATDITLWESGGIDYRLLLRPLLPEETQGALP